MAIASIGARGTAVSGASTTTIAVTPTATIAVGRVALAYFAGDNLSATDGNTSQITSVTDTVGNTWQKAAEYTNSGGAAAAGVTAALWYCNVTNQLTTSNPVTFTNSAAIVDKCAALWAYSVGAGNGIRPVGTPVTTEVNGANGFGSAVISGLSSKEYLYARCMGKEANSITALTQTTNFTSTGWTIRSRNNTLAQILRGEFRINTSTGETSNPTLAVTGDTASVFVPFEEYTLPVTQNLTQDTRFDNSNTFYAHTVTVGTVTLTPVRYDNDQTFYAATVSQAGGGQNLTPGLYTNDQTFYGPTVTRGAVTLTPNLYSNAQTFFAPTVGRGAVTLTPARYDNGQVFYSATVTRGAVTLQPARYDNAQVFYAPVVAAGGAVLAPARYDNAQTFYGPTVTTLNNLTPARFDNAQAFYSPTVGIVAAQNLQPGLYTNPNQFFGGLFTLYITFPDWVEPGWVEDGWVAWPYFNQNQFFSATVTQGDAPATDIQRGDGVDARWTKKQRKQRDREIEQEKRDREKLRQVIEQIVDPKAPEPVEVVQTAKAVEVVKNEAPTIVLPEFPTIDLAEVTRLVTQAVQSAQQARQEQQRAAMQAEAQRVAEENLRLRLQKRRREEELMLLL